jgi:hypothetical protein
MDRISGARSAFSKQKGTQRWRFGTRQHAVPSQSRPVSHASAAQLRVHINKA